MSLRNLKTGVVITEFELSKLCKVCGKVFSFANGVVEVTNVFVECNEKKIGRYLKLLSCDVLVIECEETAKTFPYFLVGIKDDDE